MTFFTANDEPLDAIQMIRTVAKGLSRKRDSIYVLLTRIYDVGRRLVKDGQGHEAFGSFIETGKRRDRRITKSVFRSLVEIGCSEMDVKLRSRYANALRYAYVHQCPVRELKAFIKSRGGIEKCANKYIARRRRNSPVPSKLHSKRKMSW